MEERNRGGFAEIEIKSGLPLKLVPASQIIPRNRKDPIRERIYKMRRLASANPFARGDAQLFYAQAKFMEDFEDSYEGDVADFFMYYPDYQHMGYEQLRTYFTWRTKARRGEFLPVPLSYVFVYIYELLNGVGEDGILPLLRIWLACREDNPELDRYVPRWLKDYHIYYDLPQSFEDFARENGLTVHYPELFMFSADAGSCLAIWNAASSYDITKSRFYADNAGMMRECFYAVAGALGEIQSQFISHTLEGTSWFPFSRALFYPWKKQRDRTVRVGREVFYCRDGNWTADIPVWSVYSRELAGYIIKKTEACLRLATGYKYKLATAKAADLAAAIEKAVADYLREKNRKVVAVDMDNLNRIRLEAQYTQDKLTVPEEDEELNDMPYEPEITLPEGWDGLKASLSEAELEAVWLALKGGDVKAFADVKGVMLEVLADGINEKAADHIGDNILETDGGITIYEEYKNNVAEMVK